MKSYLGMLLFALGLVACNPVPQDNAQQGDGPTVVTATPIPTAPAAQRTTFTVQQGDVVEEFTFRGRWLPRDQVQLSFEVAGNVRQVNVQRNDTVNAGDILADLQINELENTLQTQLLDLQAAQRNLANNGNKSGNSIVDAQFGLASANLSLDSNLAGAPWIAITDARVRIEDAERALEEAERNYDDAVSRPNTPASQVSAAYEAVLDAQDALESARRSLYSAQVSYYQFEIGIQGQRNAVRQAEIALENAASNGGSPELVDAVVRAQLAVDRTREQIAQSTLVSPIDGVVIEVSISPSAAVQAFKAVITVALPEPLEVIANVDFNQTRNLQVGEIGTCQEANNDSLIVECIVRSIPLTSNETDQTTRVAATLPELQSGSLVDVSVVLQESRDTLWLPPQAINEFGNRTFVVLQTPEGEAVRDVRLGLRTDERVEILEGLEVGDVIVQQ